MDAIALIKAAAEQRGTGLNVRGIEVAFAEKDGDLWIGIAPTDSLWDLLRSCDLLADHWPCRERGRAHTGYTLAGLELWIAIRDRCQGKPLCIFGHSMGGCIGEAMALVAHDNGEHVKSVTTFGAPAWLKPGFMWPYGLSRQRFINSFDPIPKLWCPGYSHQTEGIMLYTGRRFLEGIILDHRLESYAHTR